MGPVRGFRARTGGALIVSLVLWTAGCGPGADGPESGGETESAGEVAADVAGTANNSDTTTDSTVPAPRRMRGHYRYMADAAVFDGCEDGTRLPVAMEGAYDDLDRAYRGAAAGTDEPLLAVVTGRVQARADMEGHDTVPTLVVDRFEELLPDEGC